MNNHPIEVSHDDEFYCLIVGSRTFSDYDLLKTTVDKLLHYNVAKGRKIHVVSGGAKGADTLAEKYAKEYGYELHIFRPEWQYGKGAGFARNRKMHEFIAQFPHRGCVAFWDGESKGTVHNFELSEEYNNNLKIVQFK